MRQYGAVKGNAWESDREFLAEKARAVEKREGATIAEEQMAGALPPAELNLIACDAGCCPLGCCPCEEHETDEVWDSELQCYVATFKFKDFLK